MNDIRITQYALGELAGSEREEFEKELAGSEELQRELKATEEVVNAIQRHSANFTEEMLTDVQRVSLRKQCIRNLKVISPDPSQFWRMALRVAAVVALLGAVCSLSLPAITGSLRKTSSAELPTFEGASEPATLPNSKGMADGGQVTALPATAAVATPVEAPLAQDQSVAMSGIPASSAPFLGGTSQQTAPVESSGTLAETKSEAFASALPSTRSDLAQSVPPSVVTGERGSMAMPKQSRERGSAALAYSDDSKKSNSRVAAKPALTGDVPLAGRLFRSESERSSSGGFNTESYDVISENVFLESRSNPLSTFSIDVDTASYANVRRFLQDGHVPPAGAIRTEELINYFTYGYPLPKGDAPFSVNVEVARSPWTPQHELVRIGLKGFELPADRRPAANLVFLVDVSGSMQSPDKLPLLKRGLQALVQKLSAEDQVAIAVYAGNSGLVLAPTSGRNKEEILQAIENLEAGGSTNGGAGIKLAYKTARKNFLKDGSNRVILCSDGDFNVGVTNQSDLVALIEKERASGVFLSVLGFGRGNLKDSTMEKLANKGNGNYAYIDSLNESRKVLIDQMGATLFTIAKDVKIQVEFNPGQVAGYRLVGYENRLLAKEDFNDDKKDAGEIGAGHSVTALYEIVRAGQKVPGHPSVDPLKYQTPAEPKPEASKASPELLTVKLRYKAPDGDVSKLIEVPVTAPEPTAFEKASSDFQFAAAVAAFGMKLRGSPESGDLSWQDIQKIVRVNLGEDPGSYRAEFLTLIEKASRLVSPDASSPAE